MTAELVTNEAPRNSQGGSHARILQPSKKDVLDK